MARGAKNSKKSLLASSSFLRVTRIFFFRVRVRVRVGAASWSARMRAQSNFLSALAFEDVTFLFAVGFFLNLYHFLAETLRILK